MNLGVPVNKENESKSYFMIDVFVVTEAHSAGSTFSLRSTGLPQVQIHRVRPKQAAQEGRQEGVGEVQIQVQVQAEEVILPLMLCWSSARLCVRFLSLRSAREVCTFCMALFKG